MKALLTITIIATAAMATAAVAQPRRPVTIRSDPNLDACLDTGEVRGLNPHGQNYLSVRAAPGVRAREMDRLRSGQEVVICDDAGNGQWWGVVYTRNPHQDCRITRSVGQRRPYPGPCRSGWVSRRYIVSVAG
jgi:hypothetical protein